MTSKKPNKSSKRGYSAGSSAIPSSPIGPKLIGETLNFYRLPRQHHKHLKNTNILQRLNEEIKRRTRVVRTFPSATSCLRLVRAL